MHTAGHMYRKWQRHTRRPWTNLKISIHTAG